MLVLTRKIGESILIPSANLVIRVGAIRGGRVRLRISAPAKTRIMREEILGVAPKCSGQDGSSVGTTVETGGRLRQG